MAPVEKLYGQNPYVLVPNNHCSPCVGCNTNCFDFNPRVAYFADISELDERHARYRRFFAAAFPGFILGYYQLDVGALGPVNTALAWAGQMMVSVGIFALLGLEFNLSIIAAILTIIGYCMKTNS